jgi:hypothetical protein
VATVEAPEASAWVAPAVGVAWGVGVQRTQLGAAPVTDFLTVEVRLPLSRRVGFELQLDPVELWASAAWTREPRVGASVWVDHALPVGGRWAVVPGAGLDGAVGVRTEVDAEGARVRSGIGAVAALGRVAARRIGPHGGSTAVALRGTAGTGFYAEGAWLRGTVEVERLWRVGGR